MNDGPDEPILSAAEALDELQDLSVGVLEAATATAPAEEPKHVPTKDQPKAEPEPKTFRVITDQMTRKEAAASRKGGLRESKCLIKIVHLLPDSYYVCGSTKPLTWTMAIDEARIFQVSDCLPMLLDTDVICLLDQALLAKEPPKKVMNLESCCPREMLTMLRASPSNPMIHAVVQKHFGARPPKDIRSYEELREWIDYHCEVPVDEDDIQQLMQKVASKKPAAVVHLPMQRTYSETGTARYDESGIEKSNYAFSEADILREFDDSDDFGQLIDKLIDDGHEHFEDNATQEANGDPSYSDHERDEDDGHEYGDINVGREQYAAFRRAVVDVLRRNRPQQQLSDLNVPNI